MFAGRSQRRAGTLLTTVVALAACGSPEADIPVEEDVPWRMCGAEEFRVEDVVLHKAGKATVLADTTRAPLEETESAQ